MTNVKETYKRHYDKYCSNYTDTKSKYEWAARNVFDLTTYDASLDELFVSVIMEVSSIILNRKSYDYIVDRENYINYILVCQLLDKFRWIEWGTSIRGAWFQEEYFKPWGSDEIIKSKPILEEYKWSEFNSDTEMWDKCKIEEVPFTEENIVALIEFVCDDTED